MSQHMPFGSQTIRLRHILFVLLLLGSFLAPALVINGQGGVTVKATVQARLRSGPGTNYPLVVDILQGAVMPAVGRTDDISWIQVKFNNSIGWVAASLLTISGDVNSLPVVSARVAAPANPVNPVNPSSPQQAATPRPVRTPLPTIGPRGALSLICSSHVPNSLMPPYDTNPGLHPAIILKQTGGIHPFNYTAAFAGLVGSRPQLAFCLSDPIMIEIGAQPYSSEVTGQQIVIKRLQQKIVVRVLIVNNGQTIATGDFLGAPPRDYKETEVSSELTPELNILGAAVTADQVAAWVKGFVKR